MVGLSEGGSKIENRMLIVGNGLDMRTENLLTFCFMKCGSEKKKCMSKSSRDLDCSSKRVFNFPLWRIFGQIGSSISARCTGATTAANGPEPHWNGLREKLSVVAISARFVVGRSEIPATHGFTPSPRRWVYPLERGWRKMKVKVLHVRAR